MGIPVISITLFILLGLQELIFSGYTPVHPAASGGCLIGRWIMEWWDRGENISLRDPWRKPVDESVQTTTARTILREIWYLHSPVLSLLRDNLTSFVLISFHFRGSWHKQHLCHIVETDGGATRGAGILTSDHFAISQVLCVSLPVHRHTP